jgi:hypothetical protein
MKTILKHKFILLLLAGLFAFAACNKEEQDPFTGKDSYITAFSLQQGDAVFHATIAGDVITVTVPEGFSLTQAKATVKLSENATIYPDPATVTNWEEERQFAVTAHNGTQTTKYKYTVTYKGIAHNGTVILATQAEVDAFGREGITFIDGNLIIGRTTGADSITSLAPLADLKEIVYGLTLHPTCAITSLDGLENLERVDGILQIGALPHLEALALPALKIVGGVNLQNTVTVVVDLPELIHVSYLFSLNCPIYQLQLPNLQSAGTLTLAVASNTSTSLSIISLPMLEEIDVMTVSYLRNVKKIELPELKKAGTLAWSELTLLSLVYAPKLEEVTGDIYWNTLPALTETSFPELKQASLRITRCEKLYLLDFPKLTSAKLISFDNVPVNGIADFKTLQTVGTVVLNLNLWPDKLEIPAAVQRIDVFAVYFRNQTPPSEIDIKEKNIGELYVSGDISVTKLIGDEVFHGTLSMLQSGGYVSSFPELDGFQEVDSLYINSGSIENAEISGIRKVNRGANLTSNYSGYPKAFSLPDLEEIGGDATINFPNMNPATITETISLDKLKRVGGNLSLAFRHTAVKTLSCPELTTVGGNFNLNASYDQSDSYDPTYIYSCGFETLHFPKLNTIDGKLTIHSGNTSFSNTKLKNLDGFAALRNVKAIEITRMGTIESFVGLQGAFPLASPDKWTVYNNGYNPTYQDLLDGKWTQ